VFSGWTEVGSVWNRGQYALCERFAQIEARMPFILKGVDTDNGGEFLNWHFRGYFEGRQPAVELTRSRPYCKNDQAYVEQKNYTHVRQRLGYGRMEHEELIGYRRAQGQEFQVGELEALLECHDPIQMKEDIEKRLKSIASKTQKLRTQKEKDRVRLRCAPTTPDLAQTKRPKPRTKKKSATVSPIMSQRART
jgi:hypothetical protein